MKEVVFVFLHFMVTITDSKVCQMFTEQGRLLSNKELKCCKFCIEYIFYKTGIYFKIPGVYDTSQVMNRLYKGVVKVIFNPGMDVIGIQLGEI
jgi:hypothetical protein